MLATTAPIVRRFDRSLLLAALRDGYAALAVDAPPLRTLATWLQVWEGLLAAHPDVRSLAALGVRLQVGDLLHLWVVDLAEQLRNGCFMGYPDDLAALRCCRSLLQRFDDLEDDVRVKIRCHVADLAWMAEEVPTPQAAYAALRQELPRSVEVQIRYAQALAELNQEGVTLPGARAALAVLQEVANWPEAADRLESLRWEIQQLREDIAKLTGGQFQAVYRMYTVEPFDLPACDRLAELGHAIDWDAVLDEPDRLLPGLPFDREGEPRSP